MNRKLEQRKNVVASLFFLLLFSFFLLVVCTEMSSQEESRRMWIWSDGGRESKDEREGRYIDFYFHSSFFSTYLCVPFTHARYLVTREEEENSSSTHLKLKASQIHVLFPHTDKKKSTFIIFSHHKKIVRRTREDGNLAIFMEGNMSEMPSFSFFSLAQTYKYNNTLLSL